MKLKRFLTPDVLAVLVLIGLWLLFFWRLFTPVEADQAALKKGDFSGQFVAFAAYQYQRLTAGDVPLWNPYNNGGLPFLADTQTAVFYPPRLMTIALSYLAGGWTYHALELEMTVHVLACSLFMYAFVRRLTMYRQPDNSPGESDALPLQNSPTSREGGAPGSVLGALAAAVIASYGGFMGSYPPLQLALLEAAIWLPLAALGIHEATRDERLRWPWLVLTGLALGLSWMAGHPQTSFFLTYVLIAYLGFRVYTKRQLWTTWLTGTILFGAVAGGVAAVQLLPGIEYLSQTARAGMGFGDKGNGFPFQDMVQVIFPGIISLWSPLYVGISGLGLAIIALWRKQPGSVFWGATALVGLGLSLGANSPIYALLYNVVPGMRFFRGQERAAFLVAFSLAILAGLGLAHLMRWDKTGWPHATRNTRRLLLGVVGLCSAAVVIVFNEWLNAPERLGDELGVALFSLATAAATFYLIRQIMEQPQTRLYTVALIGVLIFELFTVSMDRESNYDPIPPDEQLSMTATPLVQPVLADTDLPFRVDGYRGLHDNYGSLYGVMDMRGISPLFLSGPYALIEPELINPVAWELFAVKYVYTDWEQMPVASEVIASGEDRYGKVNLHRLDDPRPFALLVYNSLVAANDEEARRLAHDASVDVRKVVIVNHDPDIELSGEAATGGEASVISFQPEQFTIRVNTPETAVLSVSQPDYPGWMAMIDGQPSAILRAYGALAAVVVPAGDHTVQFTYDPLSYRVGAIISLILWGLVGAVGVWAGYRSLRFKSTAKALTR